MQNKIFSGNFNSAMKMAPPTNPMNNDLNLLMGGGNPALSPMSAAPSIPSQSIQPVTMPNNSQQFYTNPTQLLPSQPAMQPSQVNGSSIAYKSSNNGTNNLMGTGLLNSCCFCLLTSNI